MAFLNALGRVSRRGQWLFQRVVRLALIDGRLDQSDNGLLAMGNASDIVLTVHERPPYRSRSHAVRCEPDPVFTASLRNDTLRISDPGFVQVMFPNGWASELEPGLYDLRINMMLDEQVAVIFDEPFELA